MEEKSSKASPVFLLGAPIKMGVSLLLGIVFMLGHYFFYHSLNNQPTPDSDYNIWGDSFSVSGQQVNIAIGSIFALLVKTMLGYAIVTALAQVTWKQIRAEPTEVAMMDNVLSISTELFSLANPKLWRRYPLAMLAGLLLWLLPIISVITPATLTVRSTSYNETNPEQVPRVDFASMKLASFGDSMSEDNYYVYSDPQLEVQTIVQSVLTEGDILSITPPFPNSSWHLDFHGPALTCNHVDQSSRDEIVSNVRVNNNCSDGTVYGYLSWTRTSFNWGDQPQVGVVNDSITPFDNKTGALETATLGPLYSVGTGKPAPLTLYVAVFPEMVKRTYVTGYSEASNCPKPSTFVTNASVIECILHNVTYSGNFTFVSGTQKSVDFTRSQFLNNVSYLDKMWSHDMTASDLENLSYQAVLDAFNRVLVGVIGLEQKRNPPVEMGAPTVTHGLNITDTTIMSTVIGSTAELAFIANYTEEVNPGADHSTVEQNLPDIIEKAFENITLSMMSSKNLQYNDSSSSAPDTVPVTITQTANVYSFSKSVLWITYGVALILTLCIVGIGLSTYFASQGSYTSKFSTILRTTWEATLSTSIEAGDKSGQDPLPKYIAKSTITLASTTEFGDDDTASGSSGSGRRRQSYHAVEQEERHK